MCFYCSTSLNPRASNIKCASKFQPIRTEGDAKNLSTVELQQHTATQHALTYCTHFIDQQMTNSGLLTGLILGEFVVDYFLFLLDIVGLFRVESSTSSSQSGGEEPISHLIFIFFIAGSRKVFRRSRHIC